MLILSIFIIKDIFLPNSLIISLFVYLLLYYIFLLYNINKVRQINKSEWVIKNRFLITGVDIWYTIVFGLIMIINIYWDNLLSSKAIFSFLVILSLLLFVQIKRIRK